MAERPPRGDLEATVAQMAERLDAQQRTIGTLVRTVAAQHDALAGQRRQVVAQASLLQRLAALGVATLGSDSPTMMSVSSEATRALRRVRAMFDDDHYYQGHGDKPKKAEDDYYSDVCDACQGSGYDNSGESGRDCRWCEGRGWRR